MSDNTCFALGEENSVNARVCTTSAVLFNLTIRSAENNSALSLSEPMAKATLGLQAFTSRFPSLTQPTVGPRAVTIADRIGGYRR